MIVVEMWLQPSDGRERELLGRAEIFNDGTGTETRGNYHYAFSDKRGSMWKSGRMKDFPRKRLLGWDLLGLCLVNSLLERWNAHKRQ